MQILDYIVLVLYFSTMVGIGIWAMRRVKGQEDYFMGGRGFGKLLQTFAAFGAGTGAHEPVTVGRTGWTSGLSGVWSALMWLFVTPLYWIVAVWYRRMRHLTLGDWFVERYESRSLGAAYTLFAIVFYMFYLSTMFSAVAKFAVPLIGIEEYAGLELRYILVPLIAGIVIIYGVLGGLTAAYWTDLIQGIFIILLSVLLIPYGLKALVAKFGDPTSDGMMEGFRIMHERVSGDYFSLFAGPSSGEFPLHYIISLTLLVTVGIVVQPHFIATGGGSAKSEDEARVGLLVGNFLKRLCTVGWAMTALIALALLAGNTEIANDPDRVWGVAAREILGPLNLGLVGLMLACLLAAMMSSADAYMIVTSALVVRNVYAAYIDPHATEKKYVAVGRLTGLIIIIGAAGLALTYADVFGQFKMAVELPILFAAPFWIGMYWRRANRTSVWATIGFSALLFFILPTLLPMVAPSLRTDPRLTTTTHEVTRTTTRPVTASDVAQHEAWEQAVAEARERYQDPERLDEVLKAIGTEPANAALGEQAEFTTKRGGQAIFWDSTVPVGQPQLEVVEEYEEDNTRVTVRRQAGPLEGQGPLRLDFLVYRGLGVDLAAVSPATLETLRLPSRLLLPFVFLILVSFITPRNSEATLDRYYAKMKTEVHPDPAVDHQRLEESYRNPSRFNDRRLFPGTQLEFSRPSVKDIVGVLVSIVVVGLIIALLMGLASIGA
ncbi:sodium:solute symporter family protein [Candidatus Laterigemmans baculatus]|uniref:sodium:solute symporter family protein n=1 Tax=Candidatus Laterigemmans baculatus TaxID=2770505 RepID=UPI0013D8F2C6|nr:sodium:solute symporter family protein [Candidatus Laterigemmans baculatus]